MNQKERLKLFLKELTKLSEKYNLEIDGCGCCGSPWVYDPQGGVTVGTDLFLNDDSEYRTCGSADD